MHWRNTMDKLNFQNWLSKHNVSKKMQSDFISRLSRMERTFDYCDIEMQYNKDKCAYLLSLFKKKGLNERMAKYKNSALPIGKYQLSTYKYALVKYIKFVEETKKAKE